MEHDMSLKVCGACVYYVPRHESCILSFMRNGEFGQRVLNSDTCKEWTPYWEDFRIDGGSYAE